MLYRSLALASLLLVACAHSKPPAAVAPATGGGAAGAPVASSSTTPVGARALASCDDVRVHFAFDSADLAAGDRDLLQRSADCLAQSPAARVVIEGNADERGTVEYNVALGQRRADAVATYLERLGVPNGRVRTISYGKANPLCTEHDEACWARNRRAAVKPTHT